jgi:hypothetical protein
LYRCGERNSVVAIRLSFERQRRRDDDHVTPSLSKVSILDRAIRTGAAARCGRIREGGSHVNDRGR